MKHLFAFSMVTLLIIATATAQKTVSAVVGFTGRDTTLTIGKNESFLVELWVPNRKGFEWSVARSAVNAKFLKSQIGQAATMPGQPEQQLWFFKTTQKGTDSIRFVYRQTNNTNIALEKVLKLTVQ